jgi:hypothetical protein
MKDSFNADFYATAATVIPVLYFALAVQGSTLDAMLAWLYRVAVTPARGLGWVRKVKARGMRVMSASMILLIFVLSLAASLIGEFFAILALYQRHSTPWQALYVLTSVVILSAVVAIVTSRRLAVTVRRVLVIRRRDRRDRKHAIRISRETDEMPLISADFRNMFVRSGTREAAERLAEKLLAALPSEDERRQGTATAQEISRALEEAWPVDD